MKDFVIAIDGKSASGKGTLAKKLAKYFKCKFLPTGNLYRLVALKLLEQNIDIVNFVKNKKEITTIVKSLDFSLLYSDKLNNTRIAEIASQIAREELIRKELNKIQFAWIKNNKVAILEGRDIGTVICPQAEVKLYLTASAEARAKRRMLQYQDEGKTDQTYQQILANLIARDLQDERRKNSPLRMAEDAVLIDSSNITSEVVYAQAMKIIKEKIALLKQSH